MIIFINYQLMMFDIYRNYNKDFRIINTIVITYEIFVSVNLITSYFMVINKIINLESVPIDRGFFLLEMFFIMNYAALCMLMLLTVIWRLQGIDKAMNSMLKLKDDKKILRKMKILMRIWSKIDNLITSLSKYQSIANFFMFLVLTLTILIVVFLGYEIAVHDLTDSDLILFGVGTSFTIWFTFNCLSVIVFSTWFKHSQFHAF